MQDLINDFNDPKWNIDSIGMLTPTTEEEVQISKNNLEEMSKLYLDRIVIICKRNKPFAKYWSVMWHDVRNQFNQVSDLLTLSFYGVKEKKGIDLLTLVKAEIKALQGLLTIVESAHSDPLRKFSLNDLVSTIFIPRCEIEVKDSLENGLDLATLFVIRTLVLNAKGKSSEVQPTKIIIEAGTNEAATAFKIYDNSTPTWPKHILGHWSDAYSKGWKEYETATQISNGGGDIVAYTSGQRARKYSYPSKMDEQSLLRYADCDSMQEDSLKYVEVIYPKKYRELPRVAQEA